MSGKIIEKERPYLPPFHFFFNALASHNQIPIVGKHQIKKQSIQTRFIRIDTAFTLAVVIRWYKFTDS